MTLHPSNPSPAQIALADRLLVNADGKIELNHRTPAELAQQIDALPTPPAWYRATVLSDPMAMYETLSTLTAEQMQQYLELQVLLISRHVKESYQNDVAAAGSVEQLKADRQQAHQEQEQERQKHCQATGVDFEPDAFE
jgi:hypothetical protein